jgi:hypothetical protein
MLDTYTLQMSKDGASTDLVCNGLGGPEERVVYLALRAHFSGHFCELRKKKTITRRIDNCKGSMWVESLLQKYGMVAVCKIAQRLLTRNVFDSKSRADTYFAAYSKRICTQDFETPTVAQAEFDTGNIVSEEAENAQWNIKSKSQPVMMGIKKCTAKTQQTIEGDYNAPHIKYISQAIQHETLRTTQAIAEAACFKYACIYMKDILSQKQWLCKEAVELNKWAGVFGEERNRFNQETLEKLPRKFDEILKSLADLRHTAVHRTHIPLAHILKFMMDAESISKLCEDDASFQQLSFLRRKLETSHM